MNILLYASPPRKLKSSGGGNDSPPRLIKDEPFWKKWFWIIPVMTIVAVVGAKLASYGFAGIYYDLIETSKTVTNAWHSLIPANWLRHLVRDVQFEKMPAFAAIQVIVYNFAKHWPRKAPRRLDRIEGFLRIPNARIDNQGVFVIVAGLLWLLFYSGIGFAMAATLLWATGHTASHLPNWEVTVVGLFASFVFGRRIAKGIAYHLQRVIIRERMEAGKTKPAWWMLWPLRWRFEWVRNHSSVGVRGPGTRARRIRHRLTAFVLIAGAIALTVQGYIVIYDAAHGSNLTTLLHF